MLIDLRLKVVTGKKVSFDLDGNPYPENFWNFIFPDRKISQLFTLQNFKKPFSTTLKEIKNKKLLSDLNCRFQKAVIQQFKSDQNILYYMMHLSKHTKKIPQNFVTNKFIRNRQTKNESQKIIVSIKFYQQK
eukprot:TRINITY_DN10602_c0_g1_i2.p3 TRINITY_DN10602_c0_g1~~TRINITY_DN10602_c0_g1_i2.p3  ORF type:complete len:144 (+),score=1.47 TRINITY_DN10602_c0_g1_i2:38-433(+)